MARQPTFFIPHGGGPCFFMEDPAGIWRGMGEFLASLPTRLPQAPKAILIVSGHWEAKGFVFTGGDRPGLIYDYYGFPRHTYQLTYPAPGAPDLAERAAGLLRAAGFEASVDKARGFDHGVFVPLKVAFPAADVPVVQMSLDQSLDPALHLKAGEALAPLRDQGVLILGSGMSFHNMRGYGDLRFTAPSREFDAWLTETAASSPVLRAEALQHWDTAPAARLSHPREEHFIPFMIAAGAAKSSGDRIFSELVLETALSAFGFN